MNRYLISALFIITSLSTFATEVPSLTLPAQIEVPKSFGLDNITPEQAQRIKAIQMALQAKLKEHRPSAKVMRKTSAEWEQLIQADSFDEQEAKERLREYGEKQLDIQVMKMKAEHDTYQVLTSEQKRDLMQRRQAKKEQMMKGTQEKTPMSKQ
ncbi:periplasmic protein CpxP/Spy [Vibrio crassostreae]|nr:periplasmic protein CpxP/Spy [Vibrio crassostreae]CAK2276400.1 periplasmic protein CpxP/Spy [Vibrio crassostreae]CAK2412473.1 periplasmic protein CpxP/Spy [Vibrio crassostreae]CAK2647058.1 periplasmic protein CpxP/Spy [Vibrio crassostreae]